MRKNINLCIIIILGAPKRKHISLQKHINVNSDKYKYIDWYVYIATPPQYTPKKSVSHFKMNAIVDARLITPTICSTWNRFQNTHTEQPTLHKPRNDIL